jgi:MYXO-CTERM domain-containing protein
MARWFLLCCVALFAAATTASADPPQHPLYEFVGPRAEKPAPAAGTISPYLVFNRCIGGCTVHGGTTNDARTNSSTLPCPSPECTVGSCSCPSGSTGTWTIHEFQNEFGQIGANGMCMTDRTTTCTSDTQCAGTCTGAGSTCAGGGRAGLACTADADCKDTCQSADWEWNAIMQCLKEVYSPFAVMVSDTAPGNGISFTEDFIAGAPADIGYGATPTGGIAPGGCSAFDNVVSFSFSNISWGAGQARVWTLCGVAAQESAHAFGLEHEYSFVDAYAANMHSTCMDPMTYRTDCGGEKFFRNAPSNCGEFMERPCACGGAQNSHQKILNVFGAGTSTIPAPTAAIVFPAAGTIVSGAFNVAANAGSRRGIDHVELWLNGYNWATVPGAAFGQNGQPDPTVYQVQAPTNVPNSILDVVIKAYDDLGAEGDSATLTITKGAPCTDDASCNLAGMTCSNGRCAWPAPTGNLGDPCTYPQFCTSGMCSPAMPNMVCTQSCTPGASDACPTGYTCEMIDNANGYCYPQSKSGGGCCEAGSSGGGWARGGFALLVLGLLVRRRRR